MVGDGEEHASPRSDSGLWAGHCFLGHWEVTNRACDFSLSQRMGLYVRYLAEQGLCVQTAMGTVADSQDPPSTAAAGRNTLPAKLRGSRCAARSPAALQAQPCPVPCTTHEMESGSRRVPGFSKAQGCKRGLAGEQRPRGAPQARPPCTAPEAPLPRSPLYSEHKRH